MSKSDVNVTTFSGRLVADAKVFETTKGTNYCLFTVASNEYYPNKEGEEVKNTAFIDCVSWSKAAVAKADELVKGKPVTIVGQLENFKGEADKFKGLRIKALNVMTE